MALYKFDFMLCYVIMAPLPMSRLQLPDSLRCFVRTGLDSSRHKDEVGVARNDICVCLLAWQLEQFI